MTAEPKPVAAVVTAYSENSYADLILGRILEGYNYLGRERPDLRLVSLYTHQVPPNDWSRALAKKHQVPVFETAELAVTRGTPGVAVDGVLLIGDGGDYPVNSKGQRLLPRREFFDDVADTFQKHRRSVPVYHAKQLAENWNDAKWMVDRSQELRFPFMAGSIMPLTWRQPTLSLPADCRIAEALAVGYGDLETSGFHTLELLQCMVERRRGGECGVCEVRCLEGRDVWRIADPPTRLLNAAIACGPRVHSGDPEDVCERSAVAFTIKYCDGLEAAVLLLNGFAEHFGFAARLRGLYRGHGINGTIASCQFYVQRERPFSQFDHLVRAIDTMVRSGHPAAPVERTLLTSGILEAALTSRSERNRRIATPHLAGIRYEPFDPPLPTSPLPPQS